MNLKLFMAMMAILFSGIHVNAQYRYEIGAFGGGSTYLGDANPNQIISDIETVLGAIGRYNINYRSSIKVNVFRGAISGSVEAGNPDLPGLDADRTFTTSYYDLGVNYEYNFFPYTRENEPNASPVTPYVFVGAGITSANEIMFNIPFGLGVKYLLTERINVGAELGMRKLFSDTSEGIPALDDPDDVSGSVMINNDYITTFGFFVTIGISKREWKCKNR